MRDKVVASIEAAQTTVNTAVRQSLFITRKVTP